MDQSTADTIKDLIRSVTGNKQLDIQLDSRLIEDLGMDSVDFASLIMAAENHFGGVVEEEMITDIKTVRDIVTLVSQELTDTA